MINNNLYIHHHLGLGDMIHCNGLVRHFLENLDCDNEIYIFFKDKYKLMVDFMYRDEKRINIIPIDHRKNEYEQVQSILNKKNVKRFIRVGHQYYHKLRSQQPHLSCDQIFYLEYKIPYEYRFTKCFWERDPEEEKRVLRKLTHQEKNYIFVHDDPARGFIIPDEIILSRHLKIIRNDMSENIFHLAFLLEKAKEIHCMESAIRCMIESLNTTNIDLYLHTFRGNIGTGTSKNWIEIDYQ